jgi:hypothetical protein
VFSGKPDNGHWENHWQLYIVLACVSRHQWVHGGLHIVCTGDPRVTLDLQRWPWFPRIDVKHLARDEQGAYVGEHRDVRGESVCDGVQRVIGV